MRSLCALYDGQRAEDACADTRSIGKTVGVVSNPDNPVKDWRGGESGVWVTSVAQIRGEKSATLDTSVSEVIALAIDEIRNSH